MLPNVSLFILPSSHSFHSFSLRDIQSYPGFCSMLFRLLRALDAFKLLCNKGTRERIPHFKAARHMNLNLNDPNGSIEKFQMQIQHLRYGKCCICDFIRE